MWFSSIGSHMGQQAHAKRPLPFCLLLFAHRNALSVMIILIIISQKEAFVDMLFGFYQEGQPNVRKGYTRRRNALAKEI